MSALDEVQRMCAQLSSGLHPHPEVTEEEWDQWLVGYAGTVPRGRRCPLCGDRLALREGRYGEFWGCDGYPDCRHTERVVYGEDGEPQGDRRVWPAA